MIKIGLMLETITPLFLSGNANDGRRVTIRLVGGLNQEITFENAYYPHQQGRRVKVKVISVTAEGKVRRVTPA